MDPIIVFLRHFVNFWSQIYERNLLARHAATSKSVLLSNCQFTCWHKEISKSKSKECIEKHLTSNILLKKFFYHLLRKSNQKCRTIIYNYI